MAKVWKDADEVVKQIEVPKVLLGYEKEMKKKPNFDRFKNDEEKSFKK